MDQFEVPITDTGKIVDFLSNTTLEPRPEEFVRQRYLRILHFELQYPKDLLAREVPIYYGHAPLTDASGIPVRADIAVYTSATACAARNQGAIDIVVECKAPDEQSGYNQLVSYVFNTSANGGVWFNGDTTNYFRRIAKPQNQLLPWTGVPRPNEAWDALGRRKKSDLRRPKDIKGLLRRCHNKLHGRGVDGEEEDLTMDMVRLILAKAIDEETPGDLPQFYCTPDEYSTDRGQLAVASRVQQLFDRVIRANTDVFASHERVTVGPRAICDVVVELQGYRLLSDLSQSEDWDLMGYAYEQYTATYLKRTRGQFFTNRLLVDLVVRVLKPTYDDVILDPAGGSGGFLTGAMRYVRQGIRASNATNEAKRRQLDHHRKSLFMVEISKRLVKIAKTAMILNGDGHAGMTQGDSLGQYNGLASPVRDKAGRSIPTLIMTNPPFAGVGEGRVTDSRTLESFRLGVRWAESDGELRPTSDLLSEGAPPEVLFFERCLDWLAPGGRLGIVMPKSFLDTQTYLPARHLLLSGFRLLAVVICHKNTFQPHTGVRTCLVLLERPLAGDPPEDYPVFMAISKKVGQDSEGVPIFQRDATNNPTDILDEDLSDILQDYEAFTAGKLTPSEYRFSIDRSQIDADLRINPQAHLPNLNATIKRIEALDGVDGWTVYTLAQIMPGIRIFKGPRLKSENIIVETLSSGVEPYYTPSAILQERLDSEKFIDVSRASRAQLRTIQAIRVQHGDIVISRSGTIGRVAYITSRLDNAIVSDDLIRVRIPDEMLRHYVFAYLSSSAAQDQMLRNEYGAVQQHLEPNHISDLLIPIPDDWSRVAHMVCAAQQLIAQKEQFEVVLSVLEKETRAFVTSMVGGESP